MRRVWGSLILVLLWGLCLGTPPAAEGEEPLAQKPPDSQSSVQQPPDAKASTQQPPDTKASTQQPIEAKASEQKPSRGEELWQTRCTPCHSLYPPPKNAPPGFGIVMHYSERYREREQFAEAVARFVLAPAKDKSAMPPHAIERFGLMPGVAYPEGEIREIARWLWDTFTAPPGRPGPR